MLTTCISERKLEFPSLRAAVTNHHYDLDLDEFFTNLKSRSEDFYTSSSKIIGLAFIDGLLNDFKVVHLRTTLQ